MTQPSAKRLVLSLLSAPSLQRVEIGTLLHWGNLFDIDAATMRVTVGRLTRQALLSSPARGVYEIGPAGRLLAETARAWLHAESTVVPWDGDWLLVHSAHLGRSNKKALRARDRAFRLTGFAQWQPGLYCRPANLNESAAATRERLLQLGLEKSAVVIVAADLPGTTTQTLHNLWPCKRLEQEYRRHLKRMQVSLHGLHKKSLPAAARETMQIGEAVIRQVTSDPMLPVEMIDTKARREMIELMTHYDEQGRHVWHRFTEDSGKESTK